MPAEHTRLRELFIEACDLPADQQNAFVDEKCAIDPELRIELKRLLHSDGSKDGIFADGELTAGLQFQFDTVAEVETPEKIGRYRVKKILGEGGMGVVYLAEQENPLRNVALKVIRSGIANRELLKRFELEASVLGRLQHPGIAKIHEAGLYHDGKAERPFFAMDYIEGQSLTTFARQNDLNVRDRLNLIVQVCNAVHHAHQRGVIHRDLKPANVLVNKDGEAKILDFGVARATDADLQVTLQTRAGQLIGTLPYMSPEQISGQEIDVDTRADIYSLGVTAYEVLAGKLPYDIRGINFLDAAKVISEDEPIALSTVNRDIRGDLETIVLKSLEKDPDRRYQSAAAFADDITRFLNDEPVVARRATATYRFRKFAKRNRALVGGILTTFAVLLAGITTTSWQAMDARTQTEVAIEQAEKAKQLQKDAEDSAERATGISERLYELIMLSNPAELGPDVKVVEAMKVVAKSLDEDPPANALAEHALRNVFAAGFVGMGEMKAAEKQLLAAAKLADSSDSVHGASTFGSLGSLQTQKGQFEAARINLEKAIRIQTEIDAPELAQAKCLSSLATLNLLTQKYEAAEKNAREALAIYNRSIENSAEDRGFAALQERCHVSIKLGSILDKQGKQAEAEKQLRLALKIAKADFGETSARVGECLNMLAVVKSKEGQPKETAELFREALRVQEANFPEDHPHLAHIQLNLGQTLRHAGDFKKAEVYLAKSIKTFEAKMPPSHSILAKARTMMADLMVLTEQFDKAEKLFQDILDQNIKTFGRNDVRTTASLMDVAKAHERNDELDQAVQLVEEVVNIRTEHHGKEHSTVTSAQKILKAILNKKARN